MHQERAPGAKERSRFPIDPPDLRIRTEHPRLRAGGMRADKFEALLQRGSIDRYWSIAHDRHNIRVNTICLAPASDGTGLDVPRLVPQRAFSTEHPAKFIVSVFLERENAQR